MEFTELEIETECAVSGEELEQNIFANVSSGKPFLLSKKYGLRGEPLAIVAGGPSLRSTVDELREFKHIMVCGTAHDYVISQGIHPTFAVHCDQGAALESFQLKRDDCQYLIGTVVNNALVRHLGDCQVLLWDCECDWVSKDAYAGRNTIRGGSTAATRAPALGMVLGFREFHFFGVDSSFEDNRDRHAYEYEDERLTTPALTCKINGRKFQTSLQFLQQAKDIQTLLTHYGHLFTVEVHGDSLMRDVVIDAQINMAKFWETRRKLEKAA